MYYLFVKQLDKQQERIKTQIQNKVVEVHKKGNNIEILII